MQITSKWTPGTTDKEIATERQRQRMLDDEFEVRERKFIKQELAMSEHRFRFL